MAPGRLSTLPSFLILLFYIGRLVATVDRQDLPRNSIIYHKCNSKTANCQEFNELGELSSLLAKTDSFPDSSDVLTKLPSAIPVTFDPPTLDFREQSIGMPELRTVKLINPTNSLTLQLVSLSGTQPEFHTSFFVDKILRPGETTSFDIMFLARVLGPIEDTVLIHSSLGLFEYKVQGVGVASPFRLRTFRGARIPVNATYQPTLSLYNPFEESLQILEVYSSSEEIQLELPSGIAEGNKSVWDIRPYETKTIARVNFYGRYIDNYTAFIRIRSNHSSQPSIILPFEVEVCKANGLFLSREFLDFGVVRSGTESKLWLYIMNAGPYVVELKSMIVADSSPIKINFTMTSLKPSLKYVKVALLVFSADAMTSSEQASGVLKIWGEDHTSFYHVLVPYEAQVMKGLLEYDPDQTLFRVYEPPFLPIIRNLTLTNLFEYPVVVYSAKLSSKYQNWFSILSFQSPVVLPADGKKHSVAILKFTIQSSDCFFNTTLRLATNTSYFNIPLLCYDGRLTYDFGDKDVDALEFGILSDQDTATKLFTITNNNPVEISITSISVREGSDLPGMSLDTVKVPPPDPSSRRKMSIKEKLQRPPHVLNPGQYIIFRVNITRPKRTGKFSGEILIHSSLGKVTTIPVNYIAVKGGMQVLPKRLNLSPAFLTSPSSLQLRIKSTYTKPVKLVSLVVEPGNASSNASETLPIVLPLDLPVVNPSTTTVIGDVRLDPLALLEDQLTSIDLDVDAGVSKHERSFVQEMDQLQQLWRAWKSLVSQGVTVFKFNLKILTEMNSNNLTVPGEASIIWPKLTPSSRLSFPLTLIGSHTVLEVPLHNPSKHPLYVEPFLLSHYTDSAHKLLPLLSDVYRFNFSDLYEKTDDSFAIVSGTSQEPSKQSVNPSQLNPAPEPFVLPPRGKGTVKIRFAPRQEHQLKGLLLLRNNLTVFDYVQLSGTSSRGFITIDGVHPYGTHPLQFEFSQSMMEGYLNGMECGMRVHDLLSHWKIFHVRNSGPSPFTIKRSSINGQGCEGNGFKITNCDNPLIVYPNRTRKIEIFCTPDFTLSRITSTLHLHTSKGYSLEFPLLATLPHHMLASCYLATPPSDTELLAAYISAPLWTVALLIMIIATIFQVNWHTNRLLGNTTPVPVSAVAKDVPTQSTGGSTFDLTNIQRPTLSNKREVIPTEENIVTDKSPLRVDEGLTLSLSTADQKPSSNDSSINHEVKSTQKPSAAAAALVTTTKTITTDSQTGIRHEADTVSKPDQQYPETVGTHPSDTPTKKNKSSHPRKHSKQQERPGLDTMSASYPEQPASSDAVKQDHFQRKESDESIPSSESDMSSSTTSGSEPLPALSPDLEELTLETRPQKSSVKPKPHPSYAKEPLTGQTVEVKEEVTIEETESPVSSPSSSLPVSPSASTVTISKPRSKKKQKVQSKREDKNRRKQKERENEQQQQVSLKSKKFQGSQESLDKESIASSSTNSTDNLEDEPSFTDVQPLPPPASEESGNSNDTTVAAIEKKKETMPTSPSMQDTPSSVPDTPPLVQDTPSPVQGTPSPVQDTPSLPLQEAVVVEAVVPLKKEPTPAESKKDEIEVDSLALSKTKPVDTAKGSKKNPREEEQLVTAPKDKTCSQQPQKPIHSRPQNLLLTDKEKPSPPQQQSEPASGGSSVETDGANEKRLAPHELAASLLTNKDIIVRKNKSKTEKISSSSSSREPEAKSTSKNPTHAEPSSVDKRSSLSHEAQPFYPGYSPHQYPPPPPPLPPRSHRSPMVQPPHPGMSYDYPPLRYPSLEDYYHQDPVLYEQQRSLRKHSVPHHPKPKGYMPPHPYLYPMEPPLPSYHERTSPRVYDHSEWAGSHPMDLPGGPAHHSYPDFEGYHYPVKHRPDARPGYPPVGRGLGWRQSPPKRVPPFIESGAPPHLKSRGVLSEGAEYMWERPGPSPAQIDEFLIRRRVRQLRMEELERSSAADPSSLAHLRSYLDVGADADSRSYPASLDLESESLKFHHHQQQQQEKLMAAKKHSHDSSSSSRSGASNSTSLSMLLSQSSSAGWSALNRAPGSTPSHVSELSSLYDDSSSGWLMDSKSRPSHSSTVDDTSTCQRLWSMNSPLSNALEEQRLQAAAQLSAAPSPPPPHSSSFPPRNDQQQLLNQPTATSNSKNSSSNSYELFENSNANIWSFGSLDGSAAGTVGSGGIFSWGLKPEGRNPSDTN